MLYSTLFDAHFFEGMYKTPSIVGSHDFHSKRTNPRPTPRPTHPVYVVQRGIR